MIEWVDLNMYRWDSDYRQVLLRAVEPLITKLRAKGMGVGYSTSWVQGPHVAVKIAASTTHVEDVFHDDIDGARRALRCLSPSTGIDPENFRNVHERLALYEAVSGPLFPWLPDGHLSVESKKHGHFAAVGQLTRSFNQSTLDLDLALVRDRVQGPRALSYAFDLITSVADQFADGSIYTGYVSLFSHKEAYLAPPTMEEVRVAWDHKFEKSSDALVDRVKAISGRNPSTNARVAMFLVKLSDALETANPQAVVREHDQASKSRSTLRQPQDVPWPESSFHASLRRNLTWQQDTRDSDWFARYRLALNLTYLHLTKHGVTPHERFLLCHLVSRAVERASGVALYELLGGER